MTGLTRRLRRCEHCADSDVPPDLPEIVMPQQTTKRMTPARVIASRLPVDWKRKQSGDD